MKMIWLGESKISCRNESGKGSTYLVPNVPTEVSDFQYHLLKKTHGVENFTTEVKELELKKPIKEYSKEHPKPEKPDFDMNKDGKVDKKDLSIMAKGLRKVGLQLKKGQLKKGSKKGLRH